MGFHNVSNNSGSTLSAGIGTTDLTMSVVADVFPAVPFYLTLGATPATYEIVEVTLKTGLTFTIGRGKDGTTAKAYVIGDPVNLFEVAGLFTELQLAVTAHLAGIVSQQLIATRDLSLTGVQTITGLVGSVKRIDIRAYDSAAALKMAIGIYQQGGNQSYINTNPTNSSFSGNNGKTIGLTNGTGNITEGFIQNVTSSQFEINWSKLGTGATGTATMLITVTYH